MKSYRKSAAAPRRRRRWAVDFDGTVSHYTGWKGQLVLGPPIAAMVERIKKWLADGDDVFIYTARLNDDPALADAGTPATIAAIEAWCLQYIGQKLPVKQKAMFEKLYDDHAIQVVQNTGRTLKEEVVRILEEKLDDAAGAGEVDTAQVLESALSAIDKL
jgi:hypothetical protein